MGALTGSPELAPLRGHYRRVFSRLVGWAEVPDPQGRGVRVLEHGPRAGPAPAPASGPITRWPPALGGRLRVAGQRLVDPAGREVLLRGMNVGSKAAPFLPPHGDADTAVLARDLGADVVRLYVAWRALEPAPGVHDAAYLDQVVAAARRFMDRGVYVIVDVHQDGWGGPFAAHGAPDWATLALSEPALTLPAGAPWQLRYLDRRVWGSFEALWANAPVPATGRGLQDHYGAALAALAARFRGDDLLLGYDPINEPFPGRETPEALVRLAVAAVPAALGAGVSAGFQRLVRGQPIEQAFVDALLARARDPARHDRLVRALGPVNARFERRLAAFYGRVGAAAQAADPGRPLLIEPIGPVGVGVPTALPRPVTPAGRPLAEVIYAPHLYDSFVDSGQPWDGDLRRLARALERHLTHGRALDAPVLVGEWGHLNPSAGRPVALAQELSRLLDDARVHATYWEHRPGRGDPAVLAAASAPRPRRVAGQLLESRWDPAARRLVVRYRADPAVRAPTVLAAPAAHWPGAVRVTVAGAPAEHEHDAAGGHVHVWTNADAVVTVTVE